MQPQRFVLEFCALPRQGAERWSFGFITFGVPIDHSLRRLRPLPWQDANHFAKNRTNTAFISNPTRKSAVSIDLRILILRHQKVILDTALAELYSVPVKRLNEQIKRNRKRFPGDFMFHLTPKENKSLRSQFATSNIGRGGRRSLPYAFTEHGAIMAATYSTLNRRWR